MEFTSPRKIILSALGHVVAFNKGETKFVPVCLRAKAVEEGLDAVDADETVKIPAPVDDADRVAKIKEAMQMLLEGNDNANFTAGGMPKFKAIEELCGVKPVNADECAKLWAEVRDSADAGE